MKTDSWAASLVWGRVGAAVLALLAFVLGLLGYTLSADDQQNLNELIMAVIAGTGGILALVSKIRESKKTKGE